MIMVVVAVAAEVVTEVEETDGYHVNNNLRGTRWRIKEKKVLPPVQES